MMSDGEFHQQVVTLLRDVSNRFAAWMADEGEISAADYDLVIQLAEWYDKTGRALVAERAERVEVQVRPELLDFETKGAKRLPKAEPTTVERVTHSFQWGGKDGKWRWLAESNLGHATAGEERYLDAASLAARNATKGWAG